ncbi:MAG: hypothetical protein AAF570_15600, partial [Bacteroidota bacterium]
IQAYFGACANQPNGNCNALSIGMPQAYGHPIVFSGCNGELVAEWEPEFFDWEVPCPATVAGSDFNTNDYDFAWFHSSTCGTPHPQQNDYVSSVTYDFCSNTCQIGQPNCDTIMGEFLKQTNGLPWDAYAYDPNNIATNFNAPGMVAATKDAACIWPGTTAEMSEVGRDRIAGGTFMAVRGNTARHPGATNVDFQTVGTVQHQPFPHVFATPQFGGSYVAGETYELSIWVVNLSPGRASDLNPQYYPVIAAYQGVNPNTSSVPISPPQAISPGPNQWHQIKFQFTAPSSGNGMSFALANLTQSHLGNDFGFDRMEIRKVDCCITCGELTALRGDFDAAHGINVNANSYWTLFATYANDVLGFSLTDSDYENFQENCDNSPSVIVNTPGDILSEENSITETARQLNPRNPIFDGSGQQIEANLVEAVVHAGLQGNQVTTTPLLLCNTPLTLAPEDPCVTEALNRAAFNAEELYTAYLDSVEQDFRERYVDHCLDVEERFERIHDEAEYQYTLYYYDNTGMLQQTVPPEGVHVLRDPADLALVSDFRAGTNPAPVDPGHSLKTRYRYNSLGGTFQANTPDKGESRTWFDDLGRPVASQDARQMAQNNPDYLYSYTKYDELSRPTEVGEAQSSVNLVQQQPASFLFSPDIDNLLNNPTKQDITYTWYDQNQFTVPDFASENSRNRVTH